MKLPVDYNSLEWQERRTVREAYIEEQEGACYHCKNPLAGEPTEKVKAMPVTPGLFPENFFKWPVHLHHSHDTGQTIGAVHNHCNAVLWEHHGE